jgi:hydrogenase maturation protein HypF
MPYDRTRTTFDAFPPCDRCRSEYADPHDRRFHAQTIACPRCGPQVWCVDQAGRLVDRADEAVAAAVAALRAGRIVALRGIGGYQLLADASSSSAVEELRRRKHRPFKPFAVLCLSPAEAERLADLGPFERESLKSPANPIVLLSRRSDALLAPNVCPGVSTVGLILPTTPLHALLSEGAGRPLVCTSGNREGDPMEFEPAGAERRLAGVTDLFLHHDREIAQPIDDSVVRIIAGKQVTFRCARGLAPLRLAVRPERPVIATGGHHKSAVALSNGSQAVLAPHVGDLDGGYSRERWVERINALTRLYGVPPAAWLWDAHPDYFPTRWATEAGKLGQPVWHHHAHVAAGTAEHGLFGRPVLGVAFDGAGLGPDGMIWGGEFLVVEGARFRRIAHLRPFALPGGEAAVRDVRRPAVALLAQIEDASPESICRLLGIERDAAEGWRRLAGSLRTVRTTSCGRLFDAVAALALRVGRTDYDGQAAMLLEAACDDSASGEYRFRLTPDEPWELDWRPVIRDAVDDLVRGETPGTVALRFHRALAAAVVEIAGRRPDLPVVLSGGVFQNRRLVEEIVARFPADRPAPVWPCAIPPNDGGLAAGQLAVACAAAGG